MLNENLSIVTKTKMNECYLKFLRSIPTVIHNFMDFFSFQESSDAAAELSMAFLFVKIKEMNF